MESENPYQLDLYYKGRDISVMTTPSDGGRVWVAVIDNRLTVGGAGLLGFPCSEMAISNGKAAVEKLIDAGTDN